MSETTSSPAAADEVAEDETVRVREQTANDIGSTDAFGPEDDSASQQDD